MKNSRKILAQGSHDGACFLYSLANAAHTLSGTAFDNDMWANAVGSVPYDMRDYLAGRGTEKLDDEPNSILLLGKAFLKCSKYQFGFEWIDTVEDIQRMKDSVTSESVLILEINEGSHWVTVLDFEGAKVLSACSAMALIDPKNYDELVSPNFRRLYNRQDSIRELKLKNGRGLKISILRHR